MWIAMVWIIVGDIWAAAVWRLRLMRTGRRRAPSERVLGAAYDDRKIPDRNWDGHRDIDCADVPI